jgi:hypothetical protein
MPMLNPANITPEMTEFTKKMMEQRQAIMKEFMEVQQSGTATPEALQKIREKALKAQSEAMITLKELSTSQKIKTTSENDPIEIPSTQAIPSTQNTK